MKLFTSLIFLFLANQLLSQTIKYKFNLPKRDKRSSDTVAFRPYEFSGSYKNGTISYNIEFERDFPNGANFMENENNIKANGFRNVMFRFQFFDSNSKKLLDETTQFQIELRDGHAIPPNTWIIRFKYQIPEPYQVKFSWAFYEQPDLVNKLKETYIWSSSYIIDLFNRSKDCSSEKAIVNKKWDKTW